MNYNTEVFEELYSRSETPWGEKFRRSQIYRLKVYRDFLLKILKPGTRHLDIACGAGLFLGDYIAPRAQVTLEGMDISKNAIEAARRRYSGIAWRVGDLRDVDLGNEQYETISILEVLYYLTPEEQEMAIEKIHRALKKGGKVISSVNLGLKPYFDEKRLDELFSRFFRVSEDRFLYLKYYYYFDSLLCFVEAMFDQPENSTPAGALIPLKKLVLQMKFGKLKFLKWVVSAGQMLVRVALYLMPVALIDKAFGSMNSAKSIEIMVAVKE